MRDGGAMSPPALLGRLALAAGLLLLAWSYILPLYLATLIPFVNGLLGLEHLPFAFEYEGQALLLACQQPDGAVRRFLFTGHETACLAAVGAAALFAATPGFGFRSRICWLTGAVALFWMIDILVLCAGAHIAILNYLDGLPPEHRGSLLSHGSQLLARSSPHFLADLVGLWNVSGSPALLLLIWFFAARRRLLPPIGRPPSSG